MGVGVELGVDMVRVLCVSAPQSEGTCMCIHTISVCTYIIQTH